MFGEDPLEHLLAAAAEGDDRAFAALVRRTQPSVWRLCSLLGSPGGERDVEDLVQETYLRALRAMPTYRGEAPVLPWLLSIARRVCADDVRRRRRERRLVGRLVASAGAEDAQGPHTPIDDIIGALEPDRREAFVLTQLLGLSYQEAAAVLDCPIGTIRSRVARARADLFAQLRRSRAI
jgi:RNA polymerase sigma-70 factor (ECF subfamily)